ncbi:uncharacterized protein LOC135391191 [Ornithodoros turicata]|uniref:uncharacterized protein LOC135391191 n=1 Tax=Ornithodoros turicata TaxID=34597 RepID=UPI003138C030
MAASACAGLLLVAIAAIGTTYTYNVMLASRLEALHKLTSTASKENNESSTDLSENRTNFDIFNPFNNSEDDYLVKRRVRGRSSWNLKQRWAGKQKTSSKTTAAGASSHQLWCFVRREALASSQYGFGRLPLGLCSVIVYQSVIITFKDIRVDLASQDIDFDERRGGMKKLASLKRLNPSIQVYVQLGEPDQPPMLHSADQKRKRDSPNGVLQALLTASDAVLQDFATGVSLWISSRHLDGLAVDLRGAVLSLEPNDTGTNITTRFAHICYERLRKDDVGFVLLLPEDPVLFARYDMNALLNTGSLKLIQKSHYVSGLTKASCLSPYKAPDLSVERIVNRTLNAVPNLMSRVLLSVTFTGAFFFVDDELARNPANVTAFMQAAYHGFLPYREVCRRVLRGQWWAVTNVATDCIEAGRATEWASCFGPASGYWLVSLKGVLGGLAVFDVDGDDFDGSCGERHILLSRLQDLLA